MHFQRLDGGVRVNPAGLCKRNQPGHKRPHAMRLDGHQYNAHISRAHGIERIVNAPAPEEIHRAAHRAERYDMVENRRAAARHVVKLLKIQCPVQHRQRRHHQERQAEHDRKLPHRFQPPKVARHQQEQDCQPQHTHLHHIFCEPRQWKSAAIHKTDGHHADIRPFQIRRARLNVLLQHFFSSSFRQIDPIRRAMLATE